ncbi:MAG TPA: DUF3459 domain-containing protein [Nakamurella sp.]
MRAPYRDLAVLRRARPEITEPWFGSITVDCDDEQRWLLVDRSGVRVALKLSAVARVIPLGGTSGRYCWKPGPASNSTVVADFARPHRGRHSPPPESHDSHFLRSAHEFLCVAHDFRPS